MRNKLTLAGFTALACAALSAPAFSATAEELSASMDFSFASVSMAGVADAEKSVPASARPAPAFFMNEEACAALDRKFIVQPSRESAVNMFRPCIEAISSTHGIRLQMWNTPDGIAIFHSERPGAKLPSLLATELKKRRNQVFGHPVVIISNAAAKAAPANEKADKVICSGTSNTGRSYTLGLSGLDKHAGTILADFRRDGASVFRGEIVIFQSAIGIDPVTNRRYELNKYWSKDSDLKVQIRETDLLSASIMGPEKIENLSCRKAE